MLSNFAMESSHMLMKGMKQTMILMDLMNPLQWAPK
jgi:hypothetical protein